MAYAFGDSDLAARRLRALSEVFLESSKPFLLGAGVEGRRLAVDLGCGPGHTTRMLADAIRCERAAGLDNSEHFIALARRDAPRGVSFHVHDVTAVPFPVGPADVLYCRFLATHLKRPEETVIGWASQLAEGGVVVMEETEWIRTENRSCVAYVNIVEAMLAGQSNTLYVGRVLDRMQFGGALRKRSSEVRRLTVPTNRTARMFHMNIRCWRENAFVRTKYPSEEIDRLQNDLHALSQEPGDKIEIEWGLRQIVLERTGAASPLERK